MALTQEVDIDASGTFKYVLIKLHKEDNTTDFIVRGYAWAEYHADIYDQVMEEFTSSKIDTECTGGGRIRHDPQKKEIFVYGYSVGFGRADHSKTVKLIQRKYPGYNVHFSNEGY